MNTISVVKRYIPCERGGELVVYLPHNYQQLLDSVDCPEADALASEQLLYFSLGFAYSEISKIDHHKLFLTYINECGDEDPYFLCRGYTEEGEMVSLMSFADYFRFVTTIKLLELQELSSAQFLSKELLYYCSEPTVFNSFNLSNHLFNEVFEKLLAHSTNIYHHLEEV